MVRSYQGKEFDISDSIVIEAHTCQRMIAEGHQIASHTWSHQDLDTLDTATFHNQIYYNEMAFRNILGYFPTYLR
jgi:peptidoglycan/xylan/chitin deacetylase (PgdA/CDA1 family)